VKKEAGKLAERGKSRAGSSEGGAEGEVVALSDRKVEYSTDPDLNQSFALSVSRIHKTRHSSIDLKASPPPSPMAHLHLSPILFFSFPSASPLPVQEM